MQQPADLGHCRYWLAGRGCRNLGNCPFRHTLELLHKNLCRRFSNNKCHSDHCYRIHGRDDQRIRHIEGVRATRSRSTRLSQGVSPNAAAAQASTVRATVSDMAHAQQQAQEQQQPVHGQEHGQEQQQQVRGQENVQQVSAPQQQQQQQASQQQQFVVMGAVTIEVALWLRHHQQNA